MRNVGGLLLVVFLLYTVYVNLTRERIELAVVNFVNIPIATEHKAILLRDEKLIKSMSGGSFAPLAINGERVKLNQKLGVFTVKDLGEQQEQNVDNQLLELVDAEQIKAEVDQLFKQLADALREKQYINAKAIKGELDLKLGRLNRLLASDSESAYNDLDSSLAIGKEEAVQIGAEIEIAATNAGTVTYLIDGYESILNYDNRYKINYAEVFANVVEVKDKSLSNINRGEAFLKIISPFDWYLACEIEREQLFDFKLGDEILISIHKQDLKGEVVDVFEAGEKGILLVSMRSQPLDFYAYRVADVKIKRNEVRGVKIARNCLVKKNERDGVFQIDEKKQIYFTPIEIIEELDDAVIAKESSFSQVDASGKTKQIPTLKHGDKVVVYANKYSEGEIVE